MSKRSIPKQIPDNIQVFISHRSDDLSTREADKLAERLEAEGITVFLDIRRLQGGDKWDEELYKAVRTSDVLILLVNEDISSWVGREVDLARGASITILPINISNDVKNIQPLLDDLELSKSQYLEYISLEEYIARINSDPEHNSKTKVRLRDGAEAHHAKEYQQLIEDIYKCTRETRHNQREWAKFLRQNRKRQKFTPANRSQAVFNVKDKPYQIHIAAGDIIDLKNIDVIVNSENNYMQMARRLDNNTLSSALRFHGSKFRRKNLLADTVQDELNRAIEADDDARPVQIGSTFITSGGHADSNLVKKTKLRYIIHAATTRVDINEADIYEFVPMNIGAIPDLTKDCLHDFDELNQREENKDKPLTNIFFPVFNAGEVEMSIEKVLVPMLKGIFNYFNENPSTHLKQIHFLAYTKNELDIITAILEEYPQLSRQ